MRLGNVFGRDEDDEMEIIASQDAVLSAIVRLHCQGGFDADVTYSKGNFYKSGAIEQPRLKYDVFPQAPGVVQADCRQLPLADEELGDTIYDPPFIVAAGEASIIGNRFTSYRNMDELRAMYRASIAELSRVIVDTGRLVVKCQDGVSGGKMWWNVHYMQQIAEHVGFTAIDQAVLLSKSKVRGHNHREDNQKHLNRMYSVFWVFRREKRPRIRGVKKS